MTAPKFNLESVEAATDWALNQGHRIFQTHRYDKDDVEHVKILLELLDPPVGAVIMDAGCGIGEVSRIMHELRPDLAFVMVNISKLQLEYCPVGPHFMRLHCDLHDIKLTGGKFDCIMFNSAFVQLDEHVALQQAKKMLKPGGILFINELLRTGGDGVELEERFACRTLTYDQLFDVVRKAGFRHISFDFPEYTSDIFEEMLKANDLEHVLQETKPVVLRAMAPFGTETD